MRGKKPWELLLMRRPGGADFAPGAYVFPGGVVHAEDSEWGDDIAAAAVRELFEEVGILLARDGRGRFPRDRDCERVRDAVASGSSFSEALRSQGLMPDLDQLVLLTRWVTPALLSRRYDARFYLARMPAGQTVRAQTDEVSDWLWATPERALREREITLVYATRKVLESVAGDENVIQVLRRARSQGKVPIVEPRMVQTESGWEIVH